MLGKSTKRKHSAATRYKRTLVRLGIPAIGSGLLASAKEVLWGIRNIHKARNMLANNYELGELHLSRGHVGDALLRFHIVTALDGTHVQGWLGIARAYAVQGKKLHALKALERVLKLSPGLPAALELRARLEAPAAA
jgi:tetratricopeptide (TPR) repeat protein